MVDPHVTHPLARRAPDSVWAQLREIDERAELVYLGFEIWLLGDVRPGSRRTRMALQMLQRMEAEEQEARMAALDLPPGYRQRRMVLELVRQGFAPINAYATEDIENGYVVRDYQERTFNLENRAEAAFEENLLIADGTDESFAAAQRLADRADAAGDDWAWMFNDRKSFLAPNLEGALA